MSKALRCDRCGAYYRPDEEERETIYIPRVAWRDAQSTKIQKTSRAYEDLDLCPECAEDFEYFMTGYPLAVSSAQAEKDRAHLEQLENTRIMKQDAPKRVSSIDNDDD